jgi:hypothetical protein
MVEPMLWAQASEQFNAIQSWGYIEMGLRLYKQRLYWNRRIDQYIDQLINILPAIDLVYSNIDLAGIHRAFLRFTNNYIVASFFCFSSSKMLNIFANSASSATEISKESSSLMIPARN